ncbi:PucR family transcriptional regulator [Rothia nasimurium]|uniref:PucR family transcriptional regulator n=1 Tax=Rothia nasimurium TaxID=85336 RepID=UPI003BA25956
MTEPGAGTDNVQALQQRLHMTNQLLDALAHRLPFNSLTQRMGKLCGGSALIYRMDSQVVASSGTAPSRLIWQEVQEAGTRERTVYADIGRWSMVARKVSLHGGLHVIALASQSHEKLKAVAEPMLDTAERLISAVYGVSFEALQEERRDRERLLLQLLTGVQPAQEHHYWAALEKFGFTSYSSLRVLDIANFSGENVTDSQLSLLSRRARALRLPLLIRAQMAGNDTPESVAAVVPNNDTAEQWVGEINEQFLVGASEPFGQLPAVHNKFREAETALQIAQSLANRAGACAEVPPVYLDRVDMASWVLSQANGAKLHERSQRTVQALKTAGIYETILMYLACEQSIPQTARRLFIHTNTVRYRIQRVHEVIGSPISDPFTITNLTLCLHPQLVALKSDIESGRSSTSTIPGPGRGRH